MRPATDNYNLIFDAGDEDRVIGVSFGADFTAEHEWGIKDLRALLDINDPDIEKQKKRINKKKLGVYARKINSVEHVWTGSFIKDQLEYSYLYVGRTYDENPKKIEDSIQNQLGTHLESMIDKEGVATAWSGNDLCFVLREDKDTVEDFKKQMAKGNAFLGMFHTGNPFSNGSLTLIFIDKMPEEFKQSLLESDVDNVNLRNADDATGIKQAFQDKRDAWKKQYPHSFHTPWDYMALTPRWANKEKTEVKYWLNPSVQSLVNYGWYTVDDLKDWLNEVPNEIVPEANWPKLKWECKDKNFSRLSYEYPEFFDYEPKYHSAKSYGWSSSKRIVRGAPKYYESDFQVIIEHILYLYYRDIKDQVEILGKSLGEADRPRPQEQERVFGFCEAMTMLGLGFFGACNTPKNKNNFSWLKDVLAMQAWFLVAKEAGYISEEDENQFLKPLKGAHNETL